MAEDFQYLKTKLSDITDEQLIDFTKLALDSLPEKDLQNAIVAAADRLPKDDKKETAQRIGGTLDPPGEQTRDRLWGVVVWSFSIVLVVSFLALAVAMFVKVDEPMAKPELILSMFTSVVGFLSGLFVPSPVAK